MSSSKWNERNNSKRKKRKEDLLNQIWSQKKRLEEEKRKPLKISRAVTFSIYSLLVFTIFIQIEKYIQTVRVSVTAIVVEIGTLFFILILFSQYRLLKREIGSILPDMPHDYYGFSARGRSRTTLNKIYDVNKNTLDKLFDKLKTFSTAWLAVAGGLGSTVFAEILKVGISDLITALVSVLCSALIWSIAQNLYGILNYDLAKKTKDLSLWWIELTM